MILQVFKHILITLTVILMQPLLASLFEIRGIAFDLSLIWLSFLCLQYRRKSSIIWGFTLGLLMDLTGGGILGLHAFSLVIAGYVGSLISGVPQQGKPFSIRFTLMLVLSLLNSIIPLLFRTIDAEAGLGSLLLRYGFPNFLYTLIAGLILHAVHSILDWCRGDARN
ncbi:rod shape-determining protein MreD [candidate division KSB1 bacterium]|nr:rod shape-determining protein MreD [candidate division KSB1 bacterium]